MQARPIIAGLGEKFTKTAESEVKALVNSGAEQVGLDSPFKGKDAASQTQSPYNSEGLYPKDTMTREEINSGYQQDHQDTSNRLDEIRRELPMHSPRENLSQQTTGIEAVLPGVVHHKPDQKPVTNVFDETKKQTTEVTQEVMQRAVQTQFHKAQELSNTNPDEERLKANRNQAVEDKKNADTEARKQQILNEQPPESQSKQSGGARPRRKHAVRRGMPRATANLKSAETRSNRE